MNCTEDIEKLQQRILQLENELKLKEDETTLLQKNVLTRSILNIPTDAILLIDLEGQILDCNETMARRNVTFIEDIIGTNFIEWFLKDEPRTISNIISEICMTRQTARFENFHRGIWNDIVLYPVFGITQQVESIAVVARDITKLKHIEEKFNKSSSTHTAFLSAIPDPVFKCNRNGVILQLSIPDYDFPIELYKNLVGEDIFGLFPSKYSNSIIFNIEKAFQKKSVQVQELKLGIGDDAKYLELRLFSSEGESFNAILRDITERKLIEEKIIVAKEKAEFADKLKTNFLAQMSHEVRTPVTSIISFISILSEELYHQVNIDMKKCFDSIDTSGKRLIRTMDLLLNMAQIQAGEYEISKTTLRLDRILTDTAEEYTPIAGKKGILFMFDNEIGECIIEADDYSIREIFNNLLDNAVTYTERGNILVRLFQVDSQIHVQIKDSGIGISEEFQKFIFTPFTQEESGYTRKFDGNGLGLAIVKHFCEFNNAEVSVESQKNMGSTLTVTFQKLSHQM